jgi:Flp pilus assembly pilin Flp
MLELYLRLQNWLKAEEGQDLIEYALIVALLVVVAVLGLGIAGEAISSLFNAIADWLTSTAPTPIT